MRIWYKYNLSEQGVVPVNEEEVDYRSQDDFFEQNFFKGHPRIREYDRVLRRILKKEDNVFSVGGGACINEAFLCREDYHIHCSDLQVPQKTLELFPGLNFIECDITSESLSQGRYDAVISLSVLFLFNPQELRQIFRTIHQSLKQNGRLIIDMGGAREHGLTFFIDNILLRCEVCLKELFGVIKGKGSPPIIKKQNGYRYQDEEIIRLATLEGFELCEADRALELIEFERSAIFRRLLRIPIFNKMMFRLGKNIPYVRMFIFRKIH